MKRAAVPKALQGQLGDEATTELVELFNRQHAQMTDDIVRAIVRELEPRFAAIEARLDTCATRDDLRAFSTKNDLRGFATKDDFRALATKDDLRAFATKDDLRAFATKDDLRALATKDDLRAFATRGDFASLRLEMAEGFGRLRADVAAQHAEMMKWMFVFWVGQAFVVLAYFRIGQYLARG